MQKRLLSLLLTLALLLTLLPQATLPAFAGDGEGDEAYSGVCGENLTWRFDPDTGLLTIEGFGELDALQFGSENSEYGPPWYSFRERITALSLPEGLTYIGSYVFSGCSGLTELHLPDSTTGIGSNAFYGCSGLTELSIPENVAAVLYEAFAFCSNLRSITFLNYACELMDGCLDGCENVTVRGWRYSSAKLFAERNGLPFESIGDKVYSGSCGDSLTWRFEPEGGVLRIEGSGAMYDYYDGGFFEMPNMPWYVLSKEIREISLPEGLSEIGAFAFYACSNLTKLNFPSSLRAIGDSAFIGCDGLTELNIPDGTVESIGRSAFYCCFSLSSVKLPEGLKEIGGFAFFQCTALTEIRLPDSLESLSVCAFNRCTSLREITLSGRLSEVDGSVFSECGNIDTVFLAAGFCLEDEDFCFPALFNRPADYFSNEPDCGTVPQKYVVDPQNLFFSADADGVLYDKDQTLLIACPPVASGSYTVPEGVVEIGEAAFACCGRLSEIHFPESLRRIGASAFSFCKGLTGLSFPGRLERIGDLAFMQCTGLRSVKLPGVEEIGGGAFRGCCDLREFVCRDADCLVIAWHCMHVTEDGDDTEEDLTIYDDNYEYSESVGRPGYTLIFGRHDAEKENAEPVERNFTGDDANYSFDSCRWLENYAGKYGFTFCDIGAFSDVSPKSYYELPVAWAVAMGITSGTGEGQFSPKKTCTREQIVSFLWKAAGAPAPEATESPFSDVTPGKYYYKAVLWAVENKITGGVGDGKFGVGKPCTREQAMTFLWKSVGSPEPEGEENPFTDVVPGKYYYKPVLWALENGITSGVSDTSFGVGRSCTRAQIVSFLYKSCRD